jgi:putative transposase
MRKLKFINGNYYHIYNRGVEKRTIFQDESDYFRFLLSMKEFNDVNPVFNLVRFFENPKIKYFSKKKNPIVKTICYSLMPNHYHFILCQLKDGGISKFMQKLGGGYTNYFNAKNKRSGVLFQGVFKAKHIKSDEYLLHLSRYIHLNSLDTFRPRCRWRENKIVKSKVTKIYNFLNKYKWHSFPFITDRKKRCLIDLDLKIFLDQFKTVEDYIQFTLNWVPNNFGKINDLVIESINNIDWT